MMKILLLGANGQVGWELQRALSPLGELTICTREQADFSCPQALVELVAGDRPDIIVNAAAYTAVDRAESDEALARQVNAESVAALAQAAAAYGAWLVHYSTDYVFDGRKHGKYLEDDPAFPLSVYGQTKLEGERAIQSSGCQYLIFRTSWVYAARGRNFIKTMLRLAGEREELHVVSDQFGAPTSAELIADVTALALQRIRHDSALAASASGIYHLVAAGETNWHSYAQYVVGKAAELGREMKTVPERIYPISTSDYLVPASRPINSRLNIDKIQQKFDLKLPHWKFHVDRMLEEIVI